MLLNGIIVNYQDLCTKELISDLKQAAKCEVKTLCRLPCHRCPNVYNAIDFEKITITGLQLDYIMIKKTEETGKLALHLNAQNILVWLKRNKIPHQTIINEQEPKSQH